MKRRIGNYQRSPSFRINFPRFVVCLLIFGLFLHLVNWKFSSKDENLDNSVNPWMFTHYDGRMIDVDGEHSHMDHPLLITDEDLEGYDFADDESEEEKEEEKVEEEEEDKEEEEGEEEEEEEEEVYDEWNDDVMKEGEQEDDFYREYNNDVFKYDYAEINKEGERRNTIGNYFIPEYGYNVLDSKSATHSFSYIALYDRHVQRSDCPCLSSSTSFCNVFYRQYLQFERSASGEKKNRNFLILIDQVVISKEQFVKKYTCLQEYFSKTENTTIHLFYTEEYEEILEFFRILSLSHYIVKIGFHNELLPLDFEDCVIDKNQQLEDNDKDDTLILSSSKGLMIRLYEEDKEEEDKEKSKFDIYRKKKKKKKGKSQISDGDHYEEVNYFFSRIGLTIKNSRFSEMKFHPLFVGHAELVNLVRHSSLKQEEEEDFNFDFRTLDLECDYPFIDIRTPLSCQIKEQEQEEDDDLLPYHGDGESGLNKLLQEVDGIYDTKLLSARYNFLDCLRSKMMMSGEVEEEGFLDPLDHVV